MLAMEAQTPLGVRQPASSLTTIATVRRLDRLAPTEPVSVGAFRNGLTLLLCLQLRQNPLACVPCLLALPFPCRCPFSERV